MPSALVLAGGVWIAWHARGSIAARDFLPVAALAALGAATALLSRSAPRPPPLALATVGLLAALAVWAALSAFWAPLPSLARDEGLLVAAGAFAFAIPPLTVRSRVERTVLVAVVALGIALVAVGTVFVLHGSRPVDDIFRYKRLSFPITYANAAAGFFVLGLWPGVALAARRSLPVAVRALGLGAATTCLAAATLAQSKGAAIGFGVSIVAVAVVTRHRLRLLLALALAVAPTAVAFRALTSPYRTHKPQLPEHVRSAGTAVLVAGTVAIGLGLLYALLDRRLDVSAGAKRVAGVAVAALVLLAAAGGAAAFSAHVDHPRAWASAKWRAFKHVSPNETASTHLLEVGSNRYDFWRVASGEWRRNPVVGDGARGFGPAYLVHGRSPETPARAHSLPFELLSEEGLVGLLLALSAFAALLVGLARRARLGDTAAIAAFATCTLALGHACFDWTFTFPALTLPFFLLAGAGLAGSDDEDEPPARLGAVTSWVGGGLAVALALFAFAPPWISAKLVRRGIEQRSLSDVRWAHRLDPVSVDPWIAEAVLATTTDEAIPPLRRARARQPRSLGVRYLLGSALFNAGRRREAQREFEAALALHPGDRAVVAALKVLRRPPAKRR